MKRKTVTVVHCSAHRDSRWAYSSTRPPTVPVIRLRGRWLEKAGFRKGEKVTVDALLGILSLTLSGRAPKTDYSVPEAQQVLGALVEKLQAIVRGLNEVHDGLPAPELHDGTLEEALAPDMAAEILGAIECIVGDCLAPAIDSLAAVAKLTEDELERELWRERARIGTARQLLLPAATGTAAAVAVSEPTPDH